MKTLDRLLDGNKTWAQSLQADDPHFFTALSQQQTPEYLWIGCSDSRVPSTQLVGMLPGEMFVHRNVANVVVHTDLNCLAVLQYAIDVLRVKHVIVCGHYGCGGVQAALSNTRLGLIDNWLRHVQDVAEKYEHVLSQMEDEQSRANKLCEFNVIEQTINVCQTTIVQSAWQRGAEFAVHGLIYSLHDGLLRNLGICIASEEELLALIGHYTALTTAHDAAAGAAN